MKYCVTLDLPAIATIEVEADSLEEAEEKAFEMRDEIPLDQFKVSSEDTPQVIDAYEV